MPSEHHYFFTRLRIRASLQSPCGVGQGLHGSGISAGWAGWIPCSELELADAEVCASLRHLGRPETPEMTDMSCPFLGTKCRFLDQLTPPPSPQWPSSRGPPLPTPVGILFQNSKLVRLAWNRSFFNDNFFIKSIPLGPWTHQRYTFWKSTVSMERYGQPAAQLILTYHENASHFDFSSLISKPRKREHFRKAVRHPHISEP